MKKLLLAVLALSLFTPAYAKSDLPGADEVMSFSLDELVTLIKDAGWQAEPFNEDGLTGVTLTIGTRQLALVPTACVSSGNCKGLYTYALIPDNPGAADLNKFNLSHNPARAITQNGTLVLDNYIVGDYGVVRGSLAVHLLVQASLIDAWWQFRQGDKNEIDLSKSVAFSPLGEPALPLGMAGIDIKPLDMPETHRFHMLQANASRINSLD